MQPISNAKPVHFPQMVYEWGNDHLGGVAWRTSVFHDEDGSVGGVPDSYILIHDVENDSIATDEEACEIRPDWNAAEPVVLSRMAATSPYIEIKATSAPVPRSR